MVRRGDKPASAPFCGCSGRKVWAEAPSPLSVFCNRRRSPSAAAWTHESRRAQVPAGIPSRHTCRRKTRSPCRSCGDTPRRPTSLWDKLWLSGRSGDIWTPRRSPAAAKKTACKPWWFLQRETSAGGVYLDAWRRQASEKDKVLLDAGVRVELLQSQVHSSLQGLGEVAVSATLGLRGGQQSSSADQQQQQRRWCSHLLLCICESVWTEGRPSLSVHTSSFRVRKRLWFSLERSSSTNG